jgi:hypothetical protein
MFKEKTKMPKTLHGPMHTKGARDPANFGKGEAQQKPKAKKDNGVKPTQFMKASKKGM